MVIVYSQVMGENLVVIAAGERELPFVLLVACVPSVVTVGGIFLLTGYRAENIVVAHICVLANRAVGFVEHIPKYIAHPGGTAMKMLALAVGVWHLFAESNFAHYRRRLVV